MYLRRKKITKIIAAEVITDEIKSQNLNQIFQIQDYEYTTMYHDLKFLKYYSETESYKVPNLYLKNSKNILKCIRAIQKY